MATLTSPDFQRAFAALSYLGGRRDGALLEPFHEQNVQARAFVRRLAHPERGQRAELLARELSRVTVSLAARTIK